MTRAHPHPFTIYLTPWYPGSGPPLPWSRWQHFPVTGARLAREAIGEPAAPQMSRLVDHRGAEDVSEAWLCIDVCAKLDDPSLFFLDLQFSGTAHAQSLMRRWSWYAEKRDWYDAWDGASDFGAMVTVIAAAAEDGPEAHHALARIAHEVARSKPAALRDALYAISEMPRHRPRGNFVNLPPVLDAEMYVRALADVRADADMVRRVVPTSMIAGWVAPPKVRRAAHKLTLASRPADAVPKPSRAELARRKRIDWEG